MVKSERILSRMHSKEAQKCFSEAIRALGINFPGEGDLAKGAKLTISKDCKEFTPKACMWFHGFKKRILRTVSEFHVET